MRDSCSELLALGVAAIIILLILILILMFIVILILLVIILTPCFAHGTVAYVLIMITGIIQRSSCTGQTHLLEHIWNASRQGVCHLCDLIVRARLVMQPAGAPGHIASSAAAAAHSLAQNAAQMGQHAVSSPAASCPDKDARRLGCSVKRQCHRW